MKKLKVDLEHCYGIKKLSHIFDFSKRNIIAIYASNGAMKSSFAQTFLDVINGKKSADRIFTGRQNKRVIEDESGTSISPDEIFVIRPYDESLEHTEKTSTLLVDIKLKQEYEQLYSEIEIAKASLIKALKVSSKSKKDIEKEISLVFTKGENNFYVALQRIQLELETENNSMFSAIEYDKIFDERVIELLKNTDIKNAIEDYIKRFNDLLDQSPYFKRNAFNYYNASNISKQLTEHKFFEAKHSINLNSGDRLEIKSSSELDDLIQQEKSSLTSDKDLRKKFDNVEKLIQRHAILREFEIYISNNEELLPFMANIDEFKEKVWKSYLKDNLSEYSDLINKYKSAQVRAKEIEQAAKSQVTQWEEVIEIFNSRFFVPFKLDTNNRTSVILGQDKVLSLTFRYEDGADHAIITKDSLLQSLSTGEKKALYILNILFEIEARKKSNQKTLYIIDDIADSFDYRNKYAIIQYLSDISENNFFRQIILTHNFDFLRTINSRFVSYENCFMAFRNQNGIELKMAKGIKNVFAKDWLINFHSSPKKAVACIPFIRNVIEYIRGEQDTDYLTLTSMLHWRPNSASLKKNDLDSIFNKTFNKNIHSSAGNMSIYDFIIKEAKDCLNATEGTNFENKIVLSIAIRLIADKYMVTKLNDNKMWNSIASNQTQELLTNFINKFPAEKEAIKILNKVVLMTPENIHLNSFMYEPIIDMSDLHLRKLYNEVILL